MRSGLTVEVLNTDAEGRMLLADALDYATQYHPELVIDMATLTGAALVVLGTQGIAMMSNADEATKQLMKELSWHTYERVAELPLWDEFKDMIRSDVADLKNIGPSGQAGTIVAGKFLECFAPFPWIHLDIAPVGWNYSTNGYRVKAGAGVGTRLLYDFLKRRVKAG